MQPDLQNALHMDADTAHVYSEEYRRTREQSDQILYGLVMDQGRIDILANFVLGYESQPFHEEMMEWQDAHQEGLLLAWRGAAKTTYCTISRCIFEILRNPNIRILIATDAIDQGKMMLRSIKSHFQHNARFRSIFGDWATGARVWTESEITVNRRSSHAGEPTIMCAGIGTTLPSRHFDVIICDDLVTEDNSGTEGQRKKVFDYFYKTLFPTLESPYGRLWVIGTRWHEEDLYGYLQKEDYKASTLIIGVLDEDTEESRWPEKYPTARMLRIRKANLGAFELQYMCRSGVGMGQIFNPAHFEFYDEIPADVFYWQGVDLAAGQKSTHDFFAHVTAAIQKTTRYPFLVDWTKTRMPFPAQVRFLDRKFREHPQTVRVIVEANAYQIVLHQTMREQYPDVPVVGRFTLKDKIARAQQLALMFIDRPLRVHRGHHDFVRLLCGFPNVKGSKDVFDALEIALGQGMRGAKKRRRKEPGLI